VKEICIRASDRLQLATVFVANQRLQLPLGCSHLSAMPVEGGPDVASRRGGIGIAADEPTARMIPSVTRIVWFRAGGREEDGSMTATPTIAKVAEAGAALLPVAQPSRRTDTPQRTRGLWRITCIYARGVG